MLQVFLLQGFLFPSNNFSVGDIINFFQGIRCMDIIFVKKDGKLVGDAVVLFTSLTDRVAALRRNNNRIGKRWIEVSAAERHDYYFAASNKVGEEQQKLVAKSIPALSSHGHAGNYSRSQPILPSTRHTQSEPSVIPPTDLNPPPPPPAPSRIISPPTYAALKLSGVPSNTTYEDIAAFFKGATLLFSFSFFVLFILNNFVDFGVRTTDIKIVVKPDRRRSGEAYARFPSEMVATVLHTMNRKNLLGLPVDLYLASIDEADRALSM